MINTTSFVKHQLHINFDLRTEQMMALSTVASREKDTYIHTYIQFYFNTLALLNI